MVGKKLSGVVCCNSGAKDMKNLSRESKIFTLHVPLKILFSTQLDQLFWLEPPTSKYNYINMHNLHKRCQSVIQKQEHKQQNE